MPEIVSDKKVFSLLEVARSIRNTLSDRYGSSFWVKAEMNKLNYYNYSGHCYPELVEKHDNKVVAQLKANLWRDDYALINERFTSIVGEPLRDGIKVLLLATIGYDPVYGLSLRIIDIDPSFTLGDLEKEKQDSILKLKEEGIFDQNRKLSFPILPQRLAIISVETSKGYADFSQIIDGNEYGYKFFQMLFPSLLQGEKAVFEIIKQLRRIREVVDHFDVVAIIRGGGGDIGLSCYNNYLLAREIALFPIPVITGIGHATNETVVEMTAHYNAITPTKLAEQMIQRFHAFALPVQSATERIVEKSNKLLSDAMSDISLSSRRILSGAGFLLQIANLRKSQIEESLKQSHSAFIRSEKAEILSLERSVANLSPISVLKRGYSIMRLHGRVVSSIEELSIDDEIIMVLSDGVVGSNVKTINRNIKKIDSDER